MLLQASVLANHKSGVKTGISQDVGAVLLSSTVTSTGSIVGIIGAKCSRWTLGSPTFHSGEVSALIPITVHSWMSLCFVLWQSGHQPCTHFLLEDGLVLDLKGYKADHTRATVAVNMREYLRRESGFPCNHE